MSIENDNVERPICPRTGYVDAFLYLKDPEVRRVTGYSESTLLRALKKGIANFTPSAVSAFPNPDGKMQFRLNPARLQLARQKEDEQWAERNRSFITSTLETKQSGYGGQTVREEK